MGRIGEAVAGLQNGVRIWLEVEQTFDSLHDGTSNNSVGGMYLEGETPEGTSA